MMRTAGWNSPRRLCSWRLTMVVVVAGLLAGSVGRVVAQATDGPARPALPGMVRLRTDGARVMTTSSQAPTGLADTSWRLVEVQSMDDAIGTARPDDPSVYTMQLNADGTVALRLDCNRATGTWSAEPSADPTNGRFEIGPLATTGALCPPPTMGEEIAGQAQYIRSYMLRDGRLYLSLMADGGIYVWEPEADQTAADIYVAPEDFGPRGYVSAVFLAPAVSPDGSVATGLDDSAFRAGQGDFDATGNIPCAQVAGQPTTPCSFGVARAGGGYATVVVQRPDGSSRAIFFQMGTPIGADTSQADGYPEFSATKENDLHLIRVGGERYEIPDAVVLGG